MRFPGNNLEDFVSNEDFVKWVKAPTEQSNAFWNAWLSKHPEKRKTANHAREVILLLEFKESKPPEGKFLEVWERISKATEERNVTLSVTSENRDTTLFKLNSKRWFLNYAALFIIFCAVLGGYSFYAWNTVTIITSFGESRTLFLPDSTRVTLNSNSRLSYKRVDFNADNRQVWLDGQAFFAVTHKSVDINFRVHTPELDVEVLGTRFDVNSRRGKSKVILEEGKVKVDIQRQDKKNNTLVMSPGEMVEVAGNSRQIKRKVVNPKDYLSWRNNRVEFVATNLTEIGQWIEDHYGYEVIFTDASVQHRKFTGSCAGDDLNELLQKLSKVFSLDIQQEGNQILIKAQ